MIMGDDDADRQGKKCRVLCAVGDEVLVGDQTFQYFNSEDMKTLQDDSVGSTAKVSHFLA